MAQGFTQKAGTDFSHMGGFAPVMRFEMLRILLTIPTVEGLHLAKWMSKGAYLNRGLTEELYMKQLIGFEVLERFVDLSNPSICWISDVHGREVFIALIFCETKKKNR